MIEQTKIARLIPRIGGALIDLLIVLIVSAIIIFVWGFAVGVNGSEKHYAKEISEELWKARGLLVGLVVDLIYTVSMQLSSKRATLGQQAVGVCIAKVNYEKATLGALLIRYIISLFSSILLKLGYLIAIFTVRKQTLHDLIAGTIVVEQDIQEKSKKEDIQKIHNKAKNLYGEYDSDVQKFNNIISKIT